jgi:hypothetical protein
MLRNFAKLNHDFKKSSKNVSFFNLEASIGYYDEIVYQVMPFLACCVVQGGGVVG